MSANKSRRYREAANLVEKGWQYPFGEAVSLARKLATARFDETLELAIKLGIDPKRSDQLVRGTVALPQ